MSSKPCSLHGSRFAGKPASIYWAWFLADGSRLAYRQLFCAECFKEGPAPLLRTTLENEKACPICHAEMGRDADEVFATVYIPKQEQFELAIQTCGADAVGVRTAAQVGAERLPDREAGMRGPSSSLTSAWDSIGLAPPSLAA
jgi:hypothetical protein